MFSVYSLLFFSLEVLIQRMCKHSVNIKKVLLLGHLFSLNLVDLTFSLVHIILYRTYGHGEVDSIRLEGQYNGGDDGFGYIANRDRIFMVCD